MFVLDDEKLANTKVIQTKWDSAASTMQRFFRRAMWILNKYHNGVAYCKQSKIDVERRRMEELEHLKMMAQLEIQEFIVQMHQQYQDQESNTMAQVNQTIKEIPAIKLEITAEKKASESLIKSIREMTHENKQLTVVDPAQHDEKKLKKEVKRLQKVHDQWIPVVNQFNDAAENLQARVTTVDQKAEKVWRQRKIWKKGMERTLKLLLASEEVKRTPELKLEITELVNAVMTKKEKVPKESNAPDTVEEKSKANMLKRTQSAPGIAMAFAGLVS